MEETFAKVVARVFSNWTALRLAVEHKMGGSNSLQVRESRFVKCMQDLNYVYVLGSFKYS